MPIIKTTTRVVASAQVDDEYNVQIQLGSCKRSFNVDDASALADEIMDACIEATLKHNADRPRAIRTDGPQLRPLPRTPGGGDAA